MYDYAYPLPNDYLCLANAKKDDDLVVWPSSVAPYVIAPLSPAAESFCIMPAYDNEEEGSPVTLKYLNRVTNPQRYTASFINALAYRLAAELSFSVPESGGKFEAMMTLYEKAKRKAKAGNLAQDNLIDELGSDSWETAGR